MRLKLHWKIFIGLILGTFFGLLLRNSILSEYEYLFSIVQVGGVIFIRLLKMIIIPLIVASIITGIAKVGSSENFNRLGIKTLAYYLSTSLLAIIVGQFIVNIFTPGVGVDLNLKEVPSGLGENVDKFGNTLLEIIPVNPIESLATNNMLQIIFFSLLFGFFISRSPENYKNQLTGLFESIF